MCYDFHEDVSQQLTLTPGSVNLSIAKPCISLRSCIVDDFHEKLNRIVIFNQSRNWFFMVKNFNLLFHSATFLCLVRCQVGLRVLSWGRHEQGTLISESCSLVFTPTEEPTSKNYLNSSRNTSQKNQKSCYYCRI